MDASPPSLPGQPFGRIADLFGEFDRPWHLCGGWAVDAWLGRETRAHGDVDIGIFEPDQRALFGHLAGWHLIGHDEVLGGATTKPWDGHDLALPAHIHARGPGEGNAGAVTRLVTDARGDHTDDLNFEFIVNRRDGGSWLLDPPWAASGIARPDDVRIAVPLDRAIRALPGGIPAASPEVLQFFKATSYRDSAEFPRPRDEADFLALLPILDEDALIWLRDAIATVVPEHRWLPYLR